MSRNTFLFRQFFTSPQPFRADRMARFNRSKGVLRYRGTPFSNISLFTASVSFYTRLSW